MTASGQREGNGHPPHSDFGLEQPFDIDSLVALRSTVAAHADRLGLGDEAVADVVLAIHELATNAVRHGGGGGRLRMWVADGHLVCEVADSGTGFRYLADGRTYPPVGAPGGRGLWIASQLSARFDVRTGPDGTVITVAVTL